MLALILHDQKHTGLVFCYIACILLKTHQCSGHYPHYYLLSRCLHGVTIADYHQQIIIKFHEVFPLSVIQSWNSTNLDPRFWHLLPSQNCMPQNTEFYSIQHMFYYLKMHFMGYNQLFVEQC